VLAEISLQRRPNNLILRRLFSLNASQLIDYAAIDFFFSANFYVEKPVKSVEILIRWVRRLIEPLLVLHIMEKPHLFKFSIAFVLLLKIALHLRQRPVILIGFYPFEICGILRASNLPAHTRLSCQDWLRVWCLESSLTLPIRTIFKHSLTRGLTISCQVIVMTLGKVSHRSFYRGFITTTLTW